MVNIVLTNVFGDLDQWPGRLFEDDGSATVSAKTASAYIFTYGAGHPFAGFRVTVQGGGFTYDGNTPLSGEMSLVRVTNAQGQVVITFSNFTPNTLASDLSQFHYNVFGSGDVDAQGKTAWSHLMSGNDRITGAIGRDRGLVGLDYGNDTFNMNGGDDEILGGMGNDTVYGGDGFDRFSFRETTYNEGMPGFQGATFNMGTNTVIDPWGGTDRVYEVEQFEGSRFNDTYIGTADRDRFSGLRGRDTVDGGLNTYDSLGNRTADTRDEVRYDNDYWQGGTRGIIANMEVALNNGSIRGTVRDGFGNQDTIYDVERVSGTRYDDSFVGSRDNNHFWGAEGRDSFDGGLGFDTLRMDRSFVNGSVGNVRVDLSRATAQILDDGFGNVETALNMEAVISGNGNDSLKGNAQDNYFEGNAGADTFTGGNGRDAFLWWTEDHFGQGDRITDFNAAADVLEFEVIGFTGMTTTLVLVNGTAATSAQGTFIYNTAVKTLFWDEDGTGGAAAVAVAQLNGVASLSASNFDLF